MNEQRAAMRREVAAFEALHATLWQQYPHQYVAIYQGAVLDHDVNELALVERLDEQYPGLVILVRQVLPDLPQTLRFRSPHFVRPQ